MTAAPILTDFENTRGATFTTPGTVPEPATILLTTFGLLAGGRRAFGRRMKNHD